MFSVKPGKSELYHNKWDVHKFAYIINTALFWRRNPTNKILSTRKPLYVVAIRWNYLLDQFQNIWQVWII